MAQSSSAAASTSTSTAPNSDHDVFINHRGLDVKKKFASHLYRRLQSYGLRVFLDQPELQRGDYFAAQIEEAIRYASVHVAIFSSRYAESTWCLRELVLMLQSNSPVIPVFYEVKPEELRWTRGKEGGYAKALEELEKKTSTDPQTGEEKLRYDPSLIQNWRNALFEAAGISGFELEACNGDEGELVDNVVEEVLKRVKKPVLNVAKYPTGLDDKVIDFENTVILPRQHAGKPQIVGIVGLGGVGKTTLAKELFNRKSSGYSRCCFLADVRDNADKGTIHVLQIELLKKLGWDKPVDNVEAKTILKRHISSPNILIILDDVDKMDQVDELLPDQTVLHSDSLILITSRSKDILRRSGVEESSMYNLNGLPPQYSLELFCLYSFNQPHPLPGFEPLAKKFTEACGGLPLSLKVFGALLNGEEDVSSWEAQLDKLQRILPEEIKQRLQISYDALDMEDRQIFLDIACFFIGEDRDRVIRICARSGGNPLWGFRNLENKCLVEVNSENQVRMHDHLRDMGREIAEASSPRRLWRSTGKIDDLLQQLSAIDEVHGIKSTDHYSLNSVMPWCQRSSELFSHSFMKFCNKQYPFHGSGICMRNLQLLHSRGVLVKHILTKVQFRNLVWLRWDKCPYSSLHSSISYLKNLRVLQVAGSKLKTLWKKESQAPLQLRELQINAPLSSIPKSIGKLTQLQRIVIRPYDLHVNVTQLPEEFCFLQSLKALVLKDFSEMKSLPECFGKLSSLHQIDLSRCSSLKSLPDSLGDLSSLHHIDLSNCSDLERLPDSLGDLSSLHHINLSNCSGLERLPDSLGDLSSLHHISLSYCRRLERLPDSFCKLIKLQHLDLSYCTNLSMSSETLGNIITLAHINRRGCTKIEVLPQQVVHQASLQRLYLRGTNLKELPSAIGELHDLEVMKVGPLLDAPPPSLYSLKSLKELQLYDNKELKCLPASLGDLRNLKILIIQSCRELKSLPASLGRLAQLTELTISDCPLIPELPFLPLSDLESSIDHCILPRLQRLDLRGLRISEVSFAEGVCFNLRQLNMSRCSSVVEVGTLPNTLIRLTLSGCHSLRKMDNIYGLAQLQRLDITNCIGLEELPCLETLVSLVYLDASGYVKLKRIRGLGQLTKLYELNVNGCSELEELEGIQHCMSLKRVWAKECPKLQWDAGVVEQLRLRTRSFYYDHRGGCLDFRH